MSETPATHVPLLNQPLSNQQLPAPIDDTISPDKPNPGPDLADMELEIDHPIGAHHSFNLALPAYNPMSTPIFTWDDYNAIQLSSKLEEAYKTVPQWRKNCFTPPFGRAGKNFLSELSRLYMAYGTMSSLESIALKLQ